VATKTQIGSEAEEFVAARKRAQKELNRIKKIINNLLDNITSANRELVDQRLTELKQQKHQLEARLEELDRLVVSQAEIKSIVADAMQFLSGLEITLCQGLAQEKLVALRRCIEKISINKPAGTVKLTVRSVPVGNLEGTEERHISL
jgi:Tfp pilus assembly protein PilO